LSPRPKLRGHSPKDRAYLRILAGKIRDARAKRGMTRNALAADSGVSLRFLAQLESGQGNPSVLVLRRIASAMGFAPDWLLSDEPMRLSVGPYKDSANAPAGDSERDQVPAIARHHQTPRASSSRVDRPLRKR
jgi:transcriptional regulator with XRE-family HTH domain